MRKQNSSRLQRYGIPIALLALPCILLLAQWRIPRILSPLYGPVLDASTVVERLMLNVSGQFSDTLERYIFSWRLYPELLNYRRQQLSNQQLSARLADIEWENQELRGLLQITSPTLDSYSVVTARVISKRGKPLSHSVVIDRGSRDGLKIGDGVVNKDGVVGRISYVGFTSSLIKLINDRDSSLDVATQRSRSLGLIQGNEQPIFSSSSSSSSSMSATAIIRNFDKIADVRVEDRLVTTGLSTGFPAGILVGFITSVQNPDDQTHLHADVQPSVDFQKLEWVSVLQYTAYAPPYIDTLPLQRPLLSEESVYPSNVSPVVNTIVEQALKDAQSIPGVQIPPPQLPVATTPTHLPWQAPENSSINRTPQQFNSTIETDPGEAL